MSALSFVTNRRAIGSRAEIEANGNSTFCDGLRWDYWGSAAVRIQRRKYYGQVTRPQSFPLDTTAISETHCVGREAQSCSPMMPCLVTEHPRNHSGLHLWNVSALTPAHVGYNTLVVWDHWGHPPGEL